jgi:hypothetical protein
MITLEIIKHKKHRYPTVGDWIVDEFGDLHIRASKMRKKKYAILVLVHELIEAVLCMDRGIAEPDIAKFDREFEAERSLGLHSDDDEPGHDPRAPYRCEHVFAESIERQLAQELGVDWEEYSNAVNSLP